MQGTGKSSKRFLLHYNQESFYNARRLRFTFLNTAGRLGKSDSPRDEAEDNKSSCLIARSS